MLSPFRKHVISQDLAGRGEIFMRESMERFPVLSGYSMTNEKCTGLIIAKLTCNLWRRSYGAPETKR
jgi:hypothetical protein